MKQLLPFKGKSQYESSISKSIQNSACGPVTAAAILEYHEGMPVGIDPLYKALGTLPIGLFKWRFVRRLQRLLGPRYKVATLFSIEEVKAELRAGRPVAMKFDKYFSFRWFDRPMYSYHWVPLIGFEETEHDLVLYLHDNGGRNRQSRLRKASYTENRRVLSFVKIVPLSVQAKGSSITGSQTDSN